MIQYTIGTVAKITGLSPDRIRAWERRYSVISPLRSSNGRRVYDKEALTRLQLLAELVRCGHKISVLAKCSNEELLKSYSVFRPEGPQEEVRVVSQIINSLVAMDAGHCDIRLSHAFVNLDPWQLASDVLLPLLSEIDSNKDLNSSQKNLLLSLLRKRLYNSIQATRGRKGPLICCATLPGENREIEALIACYLTQISGMRGEFIGADLPPSDIVDIFQAYQGDVIGIAISPQMNRKMIADGLTKICERLSKQTKLWIIKLNSAEIETLKLCNHCLFIDGLSGLNAQLDGL